MGTSVGADRGASEDRHHPGIRDRPAVLEYEEGAADGLEYIHPALGGAQAVEEDCAPPEAGRHDCHRWRQFLWQVGVRTPAWGQAQQVEQPQEGVRRLRSASRHQCGPRQDEERPGQARPKDLDDHENR